MLRCLVIARIRLARLGLLGNAISILGRPRVPHRVPLRVFSCTADCNGLASDRHGVIEKRGRTKAVHDLARLVSRQNALSSSPELQTPHDIKGFYRAVKAKNLLGELSAEELSSVIQLFGSLSVYSELENRSNACDLDASGDFALHPLAPILHRFQVDGRRSHWAFVLMVAKDKAARGLPLSESDNYWLMFAALEDLKRLSAMKRDDGDITTCVDRARKHYNLIKDPKNSWHVHQIYLTTILDHGGSKYCDEIISRLGNLISSKRGLPASLRSLLWRVLALPGTTVRDSTKSRFLQTLRIKLSKVPDLLPTPQHLANESDSKDSEVAVGTDYTRVHDALAIRDYLVDIIFSFMPGTQPSLRYLREVYPWALFECRAALCAFNDGTFATSEEEDRAAWNNLALLALSFESARKGSASASSVAPEQGLDGGVHSQSQVLGWTVVCALAAISSELHVRSPLQKRIDPAASCGVQEISRTLWMIWRKEEAWRAGAVMRSMPLICSTATAFMSLAAVSGDTPLAVSLIRHLTDSVIYASRLEGEILDRGMLRECAVHFAVLAATWGVGTSAQRHWDGILGSLRYAQLVPDDAGSHAMRLINSVANAAVIHLVPIDLLLAHSLVQSAAESGITMTDDTVLTIGKCLASEDHFEHAMDHLRERRISMSAGGLLLDAILMEALRHNPVNLRPDFVQSFLNLFTYTPILPTNNHALEAFIQACVHAGHLRESIRIVEVICESSTALLRPEFLAQLVTELISHRHYKLLGRVLQGAWYKMPSRRGSFFRSPRLHYTEELLRRFPKATSREIARSLPFSIYVWPLLRHHIPFHPDLARLGKGIIALKLSSRLQKSGKLDERSLEHAVHLLINAGRVSAALKLLNKHSSTISTKAGNIILSASLRPSRKQRRQIRHTSTRLTQLVEERGFIPDRVTLNLLMKALLRWKSITPPATIRALFDRLVMNGYPIPDTVLDSNSPPNPTSPLPPPQTEGPNNSPPPRQSARTLFGTNASSAARGTLPVNLHAFPKHISFIRHTRPLYKTFIKALNARGDRKGAWRVAVALRQVEEDKVQERIAREEARRLGRIRARERKRRGRSGRYAGKK